MKVELERQLSLDQQLRCFQVLSSSRLECEERIGLFISRRYQFSDQNGAFLRVEYPCYLNLDVSPFLGTLQ